MSLVYRWRVHFIAKGFFMALYAIGDLHLSFSGEKPMDIFGGNWIGHVDKLKAYWQENITGEDTVFLLGDLSWAMKLAEAKADFQWIQSLPGRKIAIKGNHDLWWSTLRQVNAVGQGINFLQNNFFVYRDFAICGSRGWMCPRDKNFTAHDRKIYDREVMRVKSSVGEAKKAGFTKIIVGLHFPPANDKHEDSEFTVFFEQELVEQVVYGHLHGEEQYASGVSGMRGGVRYRLASCDYLDCRPLKILE